ncbi:MAG: hypothetical protein LBH19_00025 [Dysgonamonadaceae bacterium]|jgi:hypothetical protein|nr:hypothetical protein [Dysgonamonadaceae bacterium]
MNTQHFANKGQSPCINSVGQRPTNEMRICSLRPERAIAKPQTWLTPLRGLGLTDILLFRRALPYANAQKAFSLSGITLNIY